MFEQLISIALTAVSAGCAYAILLRELDKQNMSAEDRHKQVLMPVFAVLFVLVCMPYISKICTAVFSVLQLLVSLAYQIPVIGSWLGYELERLLNKMESPLMLIIECNFILLALYIPVRKLLLYLSKFIFRKCSSHFRELTFERYYMQQWSIWQLKDEYVDTGIIYHYMYRAAFLLCCIYPALMELDVFSPLLGVILYPASAALIFLELSSFLNAFDLSYGKGESEFRKLRERDVSCGKIASSLQEVFGDRLLTADQLPGSSSVHKEEWEFEENDDIDEIISAYIEGFSRQGIETDRDLIKLTSNLMHGISTVVYNPFYRDSTLYILLPVLHEILNGNTILLICGRSADAQDVEDWLRTSITSVTNLPRLWTVAQSKDPEFGQTNIGVLSFSDLYNLHLLENNREFFQKTSLVIMIEPGNLMGTGQIALRCILEYCEISTKQLTYCFFDRNMDGLVDALSHLTRQSITEVLAFPAASAPVCRNFWNVDGPGLQNRIVPKISRYLGFGTELFMVALKKGASNIQWFSSTKFPLADLKWVAEQYYSPFCQYLSLPLGQSRLDEHLHFHTGLWQAQKQKKSFLIAEDEFRNAFEMARAFASRLEEKGHINILSENYMLRDYMCANSELLTNDPKAIPSIVPDFSRTERNLVLKLLFLMSMHPLTESQVSKELTLHGIETKNSYKTMKALIHQYTGQDSIQIQTVKRETKIGGKYLTHFSYQVDPNQVEQIYRSDLKSAYYIIENEEMESFPMGNRLRGHIEQAILPGQYFSYDGRYYEALSTDAPEGIIVRRAADHLHGRTYYRQLRTYNLKITGLDDHIRDERGILLQKGRANIGVETPGYMEMASPNDLKNAINVHLASIHERYLPNKEILIAVFPEADSTLLFTLCIMFNELFRTVYPGESDYIRAVTVDTENGCSPERTALAPDLRVENGLKNAVYFIEDSNIDLGLLVSVERNFRRFLEIITDYLDWSLELNPTDTSKGNINAVEENNELESKSEISHEKTETSEVHETENAESTLDENASDPLIDKETNLSDPDSSNDGSEKPLDVDIDGEDEQVFQEGKNSFYLAYGYSEIPLFMKLQELNQYLREKKFHDSSIGQARRDILDCLNGNWSVADGTHYCDFCGKQMSDGEWTTLKDGRERCGECSSQAVRSRKQLKKVYEETLREYERIFGVEIQSHIKVRMVNARKINEYRGDFTPTPQMDSRVIGHVQKKGDEYILFIENGAPLWNMKSTLVHELTHIWQFENWDDKAIADWTDNNEDKRHLLVEGMAVWTELQYLTSLGKKEQAIAYKRGRERDDSEYGRGMTLYLNTYTLRNKSFIQKNEGPYGNIPPLRLK